MAKLKMLKLPKKPKASASIATKRNYLDKVHQVKKENQNRIKLNAESDRLTKQIAGIGKSHAVSRVTTTRRKKRAVVGKAKPKRKAAKKRR